MLSFTLTQSATFGSSALTVPLRVFRIVHPLIMNWNLYFTNMIRACVTHSFIIICFRQGSTPLEPNNLPTETHFGSAGQPLMARVPLGETLDLGSAVIFHTDTTLVLSSGDPNEGSALQLSPGEFSHPSSLRSASSVSHGSVVDCA